ncbi:hypothetical protein PsYK624_036280 [Phanerochaete sordida]|uniref:Uncharacterized protein n=1 Tax=Phanerochaete sordida TaxID=48140 RepID=A0A9P3G467_9APHY|nr:hypothetical protein PsYK624_036280 [Phanerochaete sordida]
MNSTDVIVRVAGGAIAGLAAMGLVQGLLALVGFSPVGIVAGSIAAGVQSGIGDVAAGSLFALIQGFTMGGIAIPAWIGAAVTGILAALGLVAPAHEAAANCT